MISWLVSFLSLPAFSNVSLIGWLLRYLTFENVFCTFARAIVLAGLIALLRNYVKYDFRVPGYGLLKSLATIHLAPRKQKFTDYYLNVNVGYAKHAISIDEDRRDFKRVPWTPDAAKAGSCVTRSEISISSKCGYAACMPTSAAATSKATAAFGYHAEMDARRGLHRAERHQAR